MSGLVGSWDGGTVGAGTMAVVGPGGRALGGLSSFLIRLIRISRRLLAGWLAVVKASEGVELKKKIFPRPNASIDNDTIVRPRYFLHRFVKQTTLLRRNDIMKLIFIDMTHDNGLLRRYAV